MHPAFFSTLLAAGMGSLAVAGCSKSKTFEPRTSTLPPLQSTPSTPVVARVDQDAGVHQAEAAVPAQTPVRMDLELVAVGKTRGAKILRLAAHGSHVWLSGQNVDAIADGDGPLLKQADPLRGLPYQASKYVLLLAGTPPHLYGYRYENLELLLNAKGVVFVSTPRGWIQAKPLKDTLPPVAFLPWGEGALVVHSVLGPSMPGGNPGCDFAGERGTWFEYIAPDGSVSDPKLGIDRDLQVWSADSDGKTLSLLGTVVTDCGDTSFHFTIEFARGTAGALKTSVLFRTTEFHWAEMFEAQAREGATALVLPPRINTELGTWRPNWRTAYEIGSGTPRPIMVPGNDDGCRLIDGVLDGGSLLAIESCYSSMETSLFRVDAKKVERVVLPELAEDKSGFRLATSGDKTTLRCAAAKVLLRAPDDLWIQATCNDDDGTHGGVPAVFRRGHAQNTVIVLP